MEATIKDQEPSFNEWHLSNLRADCERLGISQRATDELIRSQEERLLINHGSSTVYVKGRSCRDGYSQAKKRYSELLSEIGDIGTARDQVMAEFHISRATFYRNVV